MSTATGGFARAGRVAEIDGIFRAHVQYRGENGRNANLYGPRRMLASEAEGDLESMRAAAAVFPNDRVQAFQSMHAEARRIQMRVKYERDIEMARLRRVASVETDSENDEAGDLLVEEEDEWWRDLQDGKITIEDVGVKKEVKPRGPINSPIEATDHLMNTFRPIEESVKELRRLLELRADPNAPIVTSGSGLSVQPDSTGLFCSLVEGHLTFFAPGPPTPQSAHFDHFLACPECCGSGTRRLIFFACWSLGPRSGPKWAQNANVSDLGVSAPKNGRKCSREGGFEHFGALAPEVACEREVNEKTVNIHRHLLENVKTLAPALLQALPGWAESEISRALRQKRRKSRALG